MIAAMNVVRFVRSSGGAFFAPNAVVVGDVTIGEGASVWFNAVIRGDVAPISIGRRVNVQDNATIHCDSNVANIIEDDVTIGHAAVVHGAHIGAGTLIGMSATVLGKSKIGKRCLIAAGAVVSPGMEVPDDHVVMGVPGKIVRPTREAEQAYMRWLSAHYVELAAKYAGEGFKDVTKHEVTQG